MPWSVSDYNTNPALNTAINGIDIAELSSASGYNNALRQMMADIKTWTATQAVSYPISIANGGTGQTSAAAALAALGGLGAEYRDLVRLDQSADFILVNSMRGYGLGWVGATGTMVIPPNVSETFNNGAVFVIFVAGGTLTVARGAGVILHVNGSSSNTDATLATGAVATLIRWGADIWTINGAGVS